MSGPGRGEAERGEGEPDLAAFGTVREGQLVLDLAGGRGRGAAAALEAGARVVLLDRSLEAMGRADPGLLARARAVAGDAGALPFRAGLFDVVLLRAAVHHLAEPAVALREAARVTRPGGAVVVVDKTGPADLPLRALRNAIERIRHPGHVWAHAERELRSLAAAARLEVEASRSWGEIHDAEEWIARGRCDPPWDGIVRELLRADLAGGGKATGVREGPAGGLFLEERWAALRLRKGGGRR